MSDKLKALREETARSFFKLQAASREFTEAASNERREARQVLRSQEAQEISKLKDRIEHLEISLREAYAKNEKLEKRIVKLAAVLDE